MIAMDPELTFPVTLAGAAGKPEAERPVFVCHHPTQRETARMSRLAKEADEEKEPEKSGELLAQAIGVVLVGWRNVRDRKRAEVAFDAGRLPDLLTGRELWELYFAIATAAALSEEDLKKSGSPSPSATAGSAGAAAPGGA